MNSIGQKYAYVHVGLCFFTNRKICVKNSLKSQNFFYKNKMKFLKFSRRARFKIFSTIIQTTEFLYLDCESDAATNKIKRLLAVGEALIHLRKT